MKLLFLFLVFFLAQTAVKSQTAKAQSLPEWARVYTYDDSIIELNTKYVMFSDQKTERIRLRWSFQNTQTLDKKLRIKYRSILEEVQLDCRKRNFKLYSIQWLNEKGSIVANEAYEENTGRKKIQFGSMMDKIFEPACKLIELRKKEPPVEPK